MATPSKRFRKRTTPWHTKRPGSNRENPQCPQILRGAPAGLVGAAHGCPHMGLVWLPQHAPTEGPGHSGSESQWPSVRGGRYGAASRAVSHSSIEDAVAENKTIIPAQLQTMEFALSLSPARPTSMCSSPRMSQTSKAIQRHQSQAERAQHPTAGKVQVRSGSERLGDTAALMLTIASPKADQAESIFERKRSNPPRIGPGKEETHRTRCTRRDRLFVPRSISPATMLDAVQLIRATSG